MRFSPLQIVRSLPMFARGLGLAAAPVAGFAAANVAGCDADDAMYASSGEVHGYLVKGYLTRCEVVESGAPFKDFAAEGGKCPAADDCYLAEPPPQQGLDMALAHFEYTGRCQVKCGMWSGGAKSVWTTYPFTVRSDGSDPVMENCFAGGSHGSIDNYTCQAGTPPPSIDAKGNPRPNCKAWEIPPGGYLK